MMRKYSIAEVAEKTQKLPSEVAFIGPLDCNRNILTLSADLLSDLCDSALSGIVRE